MRKQARLFTQPFRQTRRLRKYPRRNYVRAKRKRAIKAMMRSARDTTARRGQQLARAPEARHPEGSVEQNSGR